MFRLNPGGARKIESRILHQYKERLLESAQRNEWKRNGEGARFTGTFQTGSDAESRLAAMRSRVLCLGSSAEGDLLYSMDIDGSSGIYRKHTEEASEGIVLSDSQYRYLDFDRKESRIVFSAELAGECHIGVQGSEIGDLRFYTEGSSWESAPTWSRSEADVLYFSSAGLEEKEDRPAAPSPDRLPSVPEIITAMYTVAQGRRRGPAALCRLDLRSGDLSEVLSDKRYDYLTPMQHADGALYYMKRPYQQSKEDSGNPLGCLVDLLMFPFRLLGALFGALNVFSVKYSGKTLSKSASAKTKDEQKMIIDGNLIEAEKELRANRARGEKYPGIIPSSWELRVRTPDGEDRCLRKGVLAYTLDGSDLLYSNGSGIFRQKPDGSVEKLSGESKVTFLRTLPAETLRHN